MANLEHEKIVKQGVAAIAKWRDANPSVCLDLTKADLAGLYLRGAPLSKANLALANLTETILIQADLAGANLLGATLTATNLTEATLTEASLLETNLALADLSGATLTRASFFETVFGNTNLRAVQELETCYHIGPSTLDYRTLIRSGPLPLLFLRRCGFSDLEIEIAKLYRQDLSPQDVTAIAAQIAQIRNKHPIQYYSCFLSYSSQDEDFAKRLDADLRAHSVRCYFAPKEMRGNDFLHEQIKKAIEGHDKFLLVLSPHSMASAWVESELRWACRRERRDRCRILIPVCLVDYTAVEDWECFDADTGRDLAVEVRRSLVRDFTHWKDHDAYQRAFKRLLQDLRLETQTRHGPTERTNA